MFSVPRDKGKGRGKEDNKSYDDMNPAGVGVGRNDGKSKREKRHQQAVDNTE
jgi:hypothetical protein